MAYHGGFSQTRDHQLHAATRFQEDAGRDQGNQERRGCVEFLQSFDIVVHPRCQHTIDELTLFSYATDPLTGLVLPKLADKDNHVIDALRYACEGARRAKKKPEKQDRPLEVGHWMAA